MRPTETVSELLFQVIAGDGSLTPQQTATAEESVLAAGLWVPRVPCDCDEGIRHTHPIGAEDDGECSDCAPCPSCVDGMTWPDEAMQTIVDILTHDETGDFMAEGQTGWDWVASVVLSGLAEAQGAVAGTEDLGGCK